MLLILRFFSAYAARQSTSQSACTRLCPRLRSTSDGRPVTSKAESPVRETREDPPRSSEPAISEPAIGVQLKKDLRSQTLQESAGRARQGSPEGDSEISKVSVTNEAVNLLKTNTDCFQTGPKSHQVTENRYLVS